MKFKQIKLKIKKRKFKAKIIKFLKFKNKKIDKMKINKI